MPAIFISYRREDSIAYSGRLYDRLTAEFGKGQVFMDIDSIDPGADFIEAIEQTVAACDAVLVVIGRQWLTVADPQGRRRIENPEDFVRLEVETALSRKVRVVPILVGGAQMPRSDELPATLGGLLRRHALDLPDTAFHQTLGRLIDSLRRDETKAREQSEQERLALETEARERVERERLAREAIRERAEKEREPAGNETIVPGRIADGSIAQPLQQTPSRRETMSSVAPVSGTRVRSWAVAALVGAALAGGAVVYLRTHSQPAPTQTGITAASGMARTAAGSDEAASYKRAPKVDTTTTATASIAAREPGPNPGASTRTAAPSPVVAPRLAEPPALHTGQTKVNPKDGLTYVWIPPGTFTMGCSPGDSQCDGDEKPAHQVTITAGFWMGQTPVTQQAFLRVLGKDPSRFKGALLPVEAVNWNEAQSYCQAAGMRLPTEAEWEYAARAGSTASRYGDIGQVAWYNANSGNKTHEVAQKQPNAWGLYDMLGNVWQWTADWYTDEYSGNSQTDPRGPTSGQRRTERGGSWNGIPSWVRVSFRDWLESENGDDSVGFRCVRK